MIIEVPTAQLCIISDAPLVEVDSLYTFVYTLSGEARVWKNYFRAEEIRGPPTVV